jgi:lipoprotein-anchoring transpeptidase ErfK/SrfK
LRGCLGLPVLVVALASVVTAAAAQSYPPVYNGGGPYQPPPPAYYPPPPPSYSATPLDPPEAAPPQDADAYPPPAGRYYPPRDYRPQEYPPEEGYRRYYPPQNGYRTGRYSTPPDEYAPEPVPPDGSRPPADVGAAPASPDVTGSVRPPPADPNTVASLPPEYRPEQGPPVPLAPQFQRQLVDYRTTQPPGTLIIDTPHTFLYLVMAHGKALRYGIGVGREGFTWSGTERISRMKQWPDWTPPREMIERQPYLPRFMAGGESNPLGARALYLGHTLYRIHGTNQPSTIGSFVSSGCIRLANADIEDLYNRVQVGTRVVVLPGGASPNTAVARPMISR